ncbi:MAG: hypothetical protein LQ346_003505 [Caloplaca aetnensis]|nr:MAG: hypothetical protein LQ346_003505 [Caloplaca aetnensis]
MSLESSEVVFYHEELVDTAVLTSLCVGLVVFDEADAVQFVHYSTKEFIERERDRIYPEATNDITLSCIRYLSLQPFAAGPWPVAVIRERLLEYPFATYAAKYWVQHAKQCSETLTEKTVIGIANFLSTQKLLDSWIQILAYVEHLEDVRRGEVETQEPSLSSRLADCGTALEVARELGLDAKVQALLVHRT